MKKSLIALAVLAASGAAMAQSSVTIYGVADLWVGNVKDGAGNSTTQMVDGGVSASRLGFKGTEDLGGGLKANFVLESGLDLTSGQGTADGTGKFGFNRETSVGLSGGFGAVKFGHFLTAYDDVSGATNPGFDSALSATTYVWKSAGYTSRPNQGMRYDSPSFGGFSGAVSYNLDPASDNDNSVLSLNVQYNNGPIFVGLGYQDEGDAADTQFTRLNASYDFGMAKLLLGYGNVDAAGVKTDDYTIGADVPVAANAVVSVGYASSKTDGMSRVDGWNVVGAYLLSKRTTAYGGYVTADKATGLDRAFAVGVKHTF